MNTERDYLRRLQQIKQTDIGVLLKESYKGIWETAIKKYSDSAHFVYELLQNADDAKATQVTLELTKEGLWFKHNGAVRFSISNPDDETKDALAGRLGHINAITSIGNSSKIDAQKIGKFGIGFKAVFAYSLSPHIYDDHFNFRLENYIVPVEITPIGNKRKRGETLFFFPFNHPEKQAERAFEEIEEKMLSLVCPVLFLNHLQRITWVAPKNKGIYSKKTLKRVVFGDIEALLVENKNGSDKKNIWLFARQLPAVELRILVGFWVDESNKLMPAQENAFCFFQTKEDTKLGFVVQAPFLLTDSREGIKAGEKWNEELVQQLAHLAAESLCLLKKIGETEKKQWIDDHIFEVIPYRESYFLPASDKSKISFKPLYESLFQAFQTEAILPARQGKYFASAKAYWAADAEIVELFSDEQVSELMGNPDSGWVFVSKTYRNVGAANRALEMYLTAIVARIVHPETLVRKMSAAFIESQTDAWLLRFYAYLGERKSLWLEAAKRPVALNQHRKAVIPFDPDTGTPNLFLPTEHGANSHDTIYKKLLADKEVLAFFRDWGLDSPDLKTSIFKEIIPFYAENNNNNVLNNKKQLLSHLEAFLAYYQNCPVLSQKPFLEALREIAFVVAVTPKKNSEKYLLKPKQVYLKNEKLLAYFADANDVFLLDEAFYKSFIQSDKKTIFYQFLTDVGLSAVPKINEISLTINTENKTLFGLKDIEISNKYVENQKLIDKTLDGLTAYLNQSISLEKSLLLWEFLLSHLQQNPYILNGIFEFVPRRAQFAQLKYFDSSIILTLRNEKWLYQQNGSLQPASALDQNNLHPIYPRQMTAADTLLALLDIKKTSIELQLSAEQQLALQLGRKLLSEGVTEADIEAFLSQKRAPDAPKNDIDNTLLQLKKRLHKKQKNNQPEPPEIPANTGADDQDDFSKPAVVLQKKIDQLREQTEAQIEDLTRIEKWNETANNAEQYSFLWFKALLELECLSAADADANSKQLAIQFTKVTKEPQTERTLLLQHPNRYIPASIEDTGDLQLKLYTGDVFKTVTIEVVSLREYSLRAKLKKITDITDIDLAAVTKAVIDINNPIFILDELRKAFNQLQLADNFNLQANLSPNIRFVFGPPGTGKTTYLATDEIIPLMQRPQNLKVLVLTPTNKAADILTQRIMQKMGADESVFSWLLRLGSSGNADLDDQSVVIDKNFDITLRPKNTTITTVARFIYDYLEPEPQERLHLKFLHWDYIIIDEASMITLAAIAYILYQKPDSQFIIAGDPFQIEPISRVEQWKGMNIYTMVHLDKFVNPQTVPHVYPIVSLQKQFRALPSIGNVFSYFTYEGILLHHRLPDSQKPLHIDGLAFRDINIIKFPVSKYDSIFKPNALHQSNYQIYSALFTAEFVLSITQQIRNSHQHPFRIGIICPYKAQATIIEKLLAHQHLDNAQTQVLVGTIHGFQGDECDMVFSVFNPPYTIGRSPNMFLNKQNILNVAISRARDYLFLLMPNDDTQDVDNLYKIKQIEHLVKQHAWGRYSVYESTFIEQVLFGSPTYIHDHAFATSHQSVNVYSKPEKKYEVRCEDIAVDVQIGLE